MYSREELKQALQEHPDSFDILYEYVSVLCKANDLKYAFMLTERAISVYETNPEERLQDAYLELKRLRNQLVRDHLDVILEESWPLLDTRWQPVFKLGRPREIAWVLGEKNLPYLQEALHSDQLRRLRFLGVTITDHADTILNSLSRFNFEPLRVLNLCFLDQPSLPAFQIFFERAAAALVNIKNMSIRMPLLTDRHAIISRQYTPNLESLSLLSLDRDGMTSTICDYIADDPNSSNLMSLALIGTSFGDKGLWSLMTSDNFSNLQTLDLHDGTLTNATARLLAAEIHLPHLHTLDLRYNMIDPAGLDILEKVPITVKFSDQHTRPAGRNP